MESGESTWGEDVFVQYKAQQFIGVIVEAEVINEFDVAL